MSKSKLLNHNLKTWKEGNNKYINSDIKVINILNKNFMNYLNENQKKFISNEKLINIGIKKYKIINYKIKNIYTSNVNNDNENNFKYGIIIMILNTNNYNNYVLYYEGYYPNYFSNISYIGYYPSSFSSLNKGFIKNDYYELNTNIDKNNKEDYFIKDIFKINEIRKDYLDSFKINNQYGCFNENNVLIKALNKNDCENKYTWYNKPKNNGIYDKPCKKNEECPFYKINQNYDNNRGGCINGYCELPYGMERIGYHFFKNKNNCDSKKKWQPLTDIDKCCDLQFDNKKYKYLKGPDYVFKNDNQNRFSYYHYNNCKLINKEIKCF